MNKKVITAFLSICLLMGITACGAAQNKSSSTAAPSQVSDVAQNKQSSSPSKSAMEKTDLGIKKPENFMPAPIQKGQGLRVFGSATIQANNPEVTVEIDQEDLAQIEVGMEVGLSNLEKQVMCWGKVVSIPKRDENQADDPVKIKVLLDQEETSDSEMQSQETAEENGNVAQGFSFDGNVIPKTDTDVEAEFILKSNPDEITLPSTSVFQGNDGKNYVWVYKNAFESFKPDQMELVEVEIGETDGKNVIVKNGLETEWTAILVF